MLSACQPVSLQQLNDSAVRMQTTVATGSNNKVCPQVVYQHCIQVLSNWIWNEIYLNLNYNSHFELHLSISQSFYRSHCQSFFLFYFCNPFFSLFPLSNPQYDSENFKKFPKRGINHLSAASSCSICCPGRHMCRKFWAALSIEALRRVELTEIQNKSQIWY